MRHSLLQFMGILLVVALAASCSSKDKKLKSKQASLYFGAGTQSLMERQYTAALTSLLKANELEPENSEILNNLGMAYFFKDEVDLAIRHLQRSLELNPKNSDARVNLASIHYHRKNVNDAEALFKEVLKDLTYDKQARTYYNLGILEYESRGNLAAAETYFLKAIKEDENYCPAYLQLGKIMYSTKQWEPASKRFREASMGTCTENPAAHYYQALTFIQQRRFDDARMKLVEVESRFGKTQYGSLARKKSHELKNIESQTKPRDTHASGKMLTSPAF